MSNKTIKILRIFISFACLAVLIKYIEWSKFQVVFFSVRFGLVWIPPLLMVLSFVVSAGRWAFVLKLFGISQRFSLSFFSYLVGAFYNVVLPGAVTGDLVRISIVVNKNRCGVLAVSSSVAVERFSGLLALTILGLLGSVWLVSSTDVSITREVQSLSFALFLLTILAAILFIFLKSSFAMRLISSCKILKSIDTPMSFIRNLSGRRFLIILLLSLVFQILDVLGAYIFCLSLDIEINFPEVLFAIPIVYLATVLPLSFGGIGIRESALALILSKFGVSVTEAVALGLVIYLGRVLVGLLGMCVQSFSSVVFSTMELSNYEDVNHECQQDLRADEI